MPLKKEGAVPTQIYKKEDMLRVSEIAARMRVSRQHIYNLIDQGDLKPAFRFGGRRGLRVPRLVVEVFMQGSEYDPGA
jgi:excisionase family DNA binding protein